MPTLESLIAQLPQGYEWLLHGPDPNDQTHPSECYCAINSPAWNLEGGFPANAWFSAHDSDPIAAFEKALALALVAAGEQT